MEAALAFNYAWVRATASGLASAPALLSYMSDIQNLINPNNTLRVENGEVTLANLIPEIFVYNGLSFHPDMQETNKKKQTLNIFSANLHISAYFDEVKQAFETQTIDNPSPPLTPYSDTFGLNVVRHYFGENGQVTIYVGAEHGFTVPLDNQVETIATVDSYTGFTPLPNSPSADPIAEKYKGIFLGGDVSIPTIIHELGHQLDRAFGLELGAPASPEINLSVNLNHQINSNPIGVNYYQVQLYWGGRANEGVESYEIFADIFMTATLDNQTDIDGNNYIVNDLASSNSLLTESIKFYKPAVQIFVDYYFTTLLQTYLHD